MPDKRRNIDSITNFMIFASLREDINSGWVWIRPAEFRQRTIVKITNPDTRKTIYCETLRIDPNFIKYYNAKDGGREIIHENGSVLVINEWYRKLLGDISTKSSYILNISDADNFFGKVVACIQHPQVIVRIATWLGIISVILGLLGLIISMGGLILTIMQKTGA